MAEKEKKDIFHGPPTGMPTVDYDLPSQESIDILTRLLREFDRRSANRITLPPEIERDIAMVAAAFKSIQNAVALRESPLRIATIVPETGPAGTRVTITGSNFLTGSNVRFGDRAGGDVDVVSLTEIRATVPPGSGSVAVTVDTLAGSTVRKKGFTYPTPLS